MGADARGSYVPAVTWDPPPPADLWSAVETYLALAYDGPPPPPVADRLARLRATPDAALYECDVFERDEGRLALRLGNRSYPHMKLVVETSPGGTAHFRADTHDRHVLELLRPGDPRLAELIERNQGLARAVEQAWSAQGLPTSREHWREKLARWRASHP